MIVPRSTPPHSNADRSASPRVPNSSEDPRRSDASLVPPAPDRPSEPPRDDGDRIRIREWLGEDIDLRDVV